MTETTDERGLWRRLLGRRPPVAPRPRAATGDSFAAYQEGRFGDAEKILRAQLKRIDREESAAAEMPGVVTELADLYRVQARYDEAEPLYRRAIALAEARHGSEHPALARTLNGLALLYRAQGQYEQAEPLCRRALAIAERAHGGEHGGTAAALGNLLAVYLAQGRYREAAPLFQRSLALKEHLLGPHHPTLASSFNNYAAFLRKTRSDAEASAWEARAAEIRRRKTTDEHR
jgi:tetratricopeptide (TPR) repeat protein